MKLIKTNKQKIKEYLKELSKEAVWIGEDEDVAVCSSTTKRGAFIKFKRLMKDCVGKIEADEMEIDKVGIGYFYLTTDVKKKEMEDAEWYVDCGKENEYEVWIYMN